MTVLNIEPATAEVPAFGGISVHKLPSGRICIDSKRDHASTFGQHMKNNFQAYSVNGKHDEIRFKSGNNYFIVPAVVALSHSTLIRKMARSMQLPITIDLDKCDPTAIQKIVNFMNGNELELSKLEITNVYDILVKLEMDAMRVTLKKYIDDNLAREHSAKVRSNSTVAARQANECQQLMTQIEKLMVDLKKVCCSGAKGVDCCLDDKKSQNKPAPPLSLKHRSLPRSSLNIQQRIAPKLASRFPGQDSVCKNAPTLKYAACQERYPGITSRTRGRTGSIAFRGRHPSMGSRGRPYPDTTDSEASRKSRSSTRFPRLPHQPNVHLQKYSKIVLPVRKNKSRSAQKSPSIKNIAPDRSSTSKPVKQSMYGEHLFPAKNETLLEHKLLPNYFVPKSVVCNPYAYQGNPPSKQSSLCKNSNTRESSKSPAPAYGAFTFNKVTDPKGFVPRPAAPTQRCPNPTPGYFCKPDPNYKPCHKNIQVPLPAYWAAGQHSR
uniref:BTB domain-containing protein n=1 Tax=Rhabditophanes sp. KR3021 TaxID=114890 RepID=A0AC35TJY0_9BILA